MSSFVGFCATRELSVQLKLVGATTASKAFHSDGSEIALR